MPSDPVANRIPFASGFRSDPFGIRRLYQSEGIAEKCILPCEGSPRAVLCAAPIIAAGDVTGVVALLTEDRTATPDAAQLKAVNVAAAFLARQMEE